MVIGSNDKDFDLKTVDNINGTINYNVELYSDGKDKQYCLRLAFDQSKWFFMIPTNCALLLKTGKGDVIELRALYTYDVADSDKMGYSYFPISEEQLKKITADDVVKFRIQVIVDTDHHTTYAEKEWKSSGLGSTIGSMVASVDKTWEKQRSNFIESLSKKQKAHDFNSDF